MEADPLDSVPSILRQYGFDVVHWRSRKERPLGMRLWYELLRQPIDPQDLLRDSFFFAVTISFLSQEDCLFLRLDPLPH